MALIQMIRQVKAANPIPEPEPQQSQVMTDMRAAQQEVVYGNAGQTPAGGTQGSNMAAHMQGGSWIHGLILVLFLAALIMIGNGLFRHEEKVAKKE